MPFPALIVWNVGAFIGIALAVIVLREIASPITYFFVLRFTLTIVFAMSVIVIVWKDGFMRAYAIGLIVGLVINGFTSLVTMAGGYWQSDGNTMLLVNAGIAMIGGLFCAGFVWMSESDRPDET